MASWVLMHHYETTCWIRAAFFQVLSLFDYYSLWWCLRLTAVYCTELELKDAAAAAGIQVITTDNAEETQHSTEITEQPTQDSAATDG